ncbi:MAG: caspase family protein, partial [Gaiellaceae bacterium]
MEPIRDALIIAADTYGDSKLRALRAPARDAEELARVLGDPEIGDFRVGVSLNEPDHAIRRKLSEFFQERGRDDLLLLHMSCHGLKDEDGNLYFATANTEVEHLEATAIPSEFVNRQMTRSRSRRIVLLLDCCFGGAFARGMVHRAGSGVDVAEKFDGQGRVVLTASRAMEWAFEGDHLEGEARPSIFTSALVQGLESGMADLDQDSRISVDELYEYVYEQVREATPNQTPSKWTFDVQGDLYVARSTYRAEVEPAELPLELRAAIESPFANVRAGAVEELARLLGGAHAGFSAAALVALGQLADDDSRRVSESAARALGEPAEQPEPIAVRVPEPTPPETVSGTEREPVRIWVPSAPAAEPARRESSTSVRLAVTAARARRWGTPLALAGAAALVLGYFLPAKWDESQWWYARNESETWWVWSPIEALGVALLAAAVLLARA